MKTALTRPRKYDSPSYTLQRFIPPHMLSAYLAIRAFNIEVARIADLVSNPAVGSIRMQFWRDTINSSFDAQPPAEPVAVLLASVLENYKLNKSWFLRIINTRDRYLANPPYTNLADLEAYAENTYSTLLYLTLSAYPLKSITMDHLASHIGKAAGICAILRGLPLLAFPPPLTHHPSPTTGFGATPTGTRRGVITLPLDIMARSGVREEDIHRQGSNAPGLRDAVFAVATRASDHLITARTMLSSVQRYEDIDHPYEHQHDDGHDYGTKTGIRLSGETKRKEYEQGYGIIMGPAVSTQLWLDRLQKCDFDVFDAGLRRPEWKLPFAAWWRFRKNEL
jgi:NADH dehydrogenase [ubiquinone] 1 alpha subcomplex assembly factor 6